MILRIAVLLVWVTTLVAAGTLVVFEITRGSAMTGAVMFPTVQVAAGSVGALVAWKRSRHPVGWLLLVSGWFSVVGEASGPYRDRALVAGSGPLPFGEVAAWVHPWMWLLGIGCFWTAMLLFPDGRPLARRWWLAVGVPAVGGTLVIAVGVLSLRLPIPTLLAMSADAELPGVAGSVSVVARALVFGTIPIALLSLVVRYRGSGAGVRAQIKWVLLGTVPLAAGIALFFLTGTSPIDDPLLVGVVLVMVGMVGVPVGIGVGVLRHRLFDIDHLINRTVVYAMVTAVLGGIYAATVVALQAVLRPLTSTSDLAVAAATLGVAAAFGPVRTHAQAFVDRRFNRARYDAVRTVETFAHRLRDELDLETLTDELGRVASGSLQPASVGVWLRAAGPTP